MLGICNGRFSASSETQSKSFRGGARSYFRLISVQPMKQRWFRGLTISNQRTEMTRSYNISRQSDATSRVFYMAPTRHDALRSSDVFGPLRRIWDTWKVSATWWIIPLLCVLGRPTTSAPYAHTVYSHVNYEELLVSWTCFVLGLQDTTLPRSKESANISLDRVTKISITLLRDLSLMSLGNCMASAQSRNILGWQLSGCGFCH